MGSGLTIAKQLSLTSVRVDFFQTPAPQILSAVRASDALNAANRTIDVLEPFGSFTPLAQTVAQVGEKSVEVFTDANLTPNTLYKITSLALNTLGQPLLCPEASFRTFVSSIRMGTSTST